MSTLSRDVPFSMIFFQSFAFFKSKMANEAVDLGFSSIFASGITAGAISAFLVTPMDGKKTIRYLIQYLLNNSGKDKISGYKIRNEYLRHL